MARDNRVAKVRDHGSAVRNQSEKHVLKANWVVIVTLIRESGFIIGSEEAGKSQNIVKKRTMWRTRDFRIYRVQSRETIAQ
jgi:hypothetical protein